MFPRPCIRLHLRHHGGNRATAGGQRGTGQLHHFFGPDETLRLLEILSSGNRRRGVKSTPIAHTFFSCAFCQRACPSLLSQLFFKLQSSRDALTSRTRVAQAQNRHISSRNVIRYTSLVHCTYTYTCTPSLTRPISLSSDPLLGELQTCADLCQLQRGSPILHRL